jgi:hypothetical protein
MTPALLVEYTDKPIDSSKVSLESSRISITSENSYQRPKIVFWWQIKAIVVGKIKSISCLAEDTVSK